MELSPTRALVNSSHGVTGVCKSNKNYVGMSKRQNQNQTPVTNIARMFFMKKNALTFTLTTIQRLQYSSHSIATSIEW